MKIKLDNVFFWIVCVLQSSFWELPQLQCWSGSRLLSIYCSILSYTPHFLPSKLSKIFFEELPFKTIALSTYAENLAAGKPTAQSSTYPGVRESEKAVDGNPDTEFNNGHCSHTKLDPSSSWWSVDLGSDNVLVYGVRIVNRFSQYNSIRQRSRNHIITLGEYFISSIFFGK